jgi:transketolase
MLGDGELNEGQVWEAAMAAAKFGLANLTALVDYNDLQLDGRCSEVMPIEPLRDKWRAFNWNVIGIDGHDMEEIVGALEEAQSVGRKPTVIIARTIKGKGVSFMEDDCDWHGKTPGEEQFIRAMGELGAKLSVKDLEKIRSRRRSRLGSDSGVAISKAGGYRANGKPAPTRDAYGEVLVELGEELPNLVVLEADISKSTRTDRFAARFPQRFYQFGVAEANAMTAAAGFATTGKIPFVSTYAVFASMRACEQLRTFIAYPRLNVKIAVSHGGMNPGTDGVTHQATEDLGMMRTIPGLTVIMPSDSHATRALVRAAALHDGPVYLRFTRDAVPQFYGPEDAFEIGKGVVVRTGHDVSLITLGDMLSVCLEAAAALEAEGISAEVIDMHTVKPLDDDLILSTARRTSRIVTVEDHQILCGLGGAVAELLAEKHPVRMKRIGLRDTFAESGPFDMLLKKYRMDGPSIVECVKNLLSEPTPTINPSVD